MQTHAADALHPEWRTGLKAEMIFDRGKRADAKLSTHPVLQPINSAEQADQAFDSITYNKGAAVITMLEAYIGPATFREGLDRYIQAHAYGNTVDSDSMERNAGSDWHAHPRCRARLHAAGGSSVHPGYRPRDEHRASRMSRFYEDPASAPPLTQSWRMPVAVAAPGQPVKTVLMKGDAVVAGPTPVVNAGGRSYARVFYPPAQDSTAQVRLSGDASRRPAQSLERCLGTRAVRLCVGRRPSRLYEPSAIECRPNRVGPRRRPSGDHRPGTCSGAARGVSPFRFDYAGADRSSGRQFPPAREKTRL